MTKNVQNPPIRVLHDFCTVGFLVVRYIRFFYFRKYYDGNTIIYNILIKERNNMVITSFAQL